MTVPVFLEVWNRQRKGRLHAKWQPEMQAGGVLRTPSREKEERHWLYQAGERFSNVTRVYIRDECHGHPLTPGGKSIEASFFPLYNLVAHLPLRA